jgi:hypothetical protein
MSAQPALSLSRSQQTLSLSGSRSQPSPSPSPSPTQSCVSDVIHYLQSWGHGHPWGDLMRLVSQAGAANPYDTRHPHHRGSLLGLDQTQLSHYSLMWYEQCGINFPVMYVASVYLYAYARSLDCDTLLFATRDCCHWVRIFRRMFPDMKAHYFHCSRNMFERAIQSNNQDYYRYVQSLVTTGVERAVFVDIHGTCQRALMYFESQFGLVPYCFLLSSSYRHYPQFPGICQKYHRLGKLLNIVFDARGTPIEMLNFDTVGTLQNYTKQGPLRDPPEYSLRWLEPYHTCMQYLLSQTVPFDGQHITPSQFEELGQLIRKIYRVIQDNKPVLNTYVKHPGKH